MVVRAGLSFKCDTYKHLLHVDLIDAHKVTVIKWYWIDEVITQNQYWIDEFMSLKQNWVD